MIASKAIALAVSLGVTCPGCLVAGPQSVAPQHCCVDCAGDELVIYLHVLMGISSGWGVSYTCLPAQDPANPALPQTRSPRSWPPIHTTRQKHLPPPLQVLSVDLACPTPEASTAAAAHINNQSKSINAIGDIGHWLYQQKSRTGRTTCLWCAQGAACALRLNNLVLLP